MKLSDFDFDLPEGLIALRPSEPRDSARQLVLCSKNGLIDTHVNKIGDYLRAGDTLIFNDTKVIPTRLMAQKGQAKVEVTLIKRHGPTLWSALLKNARRVRAGDILVFLDGIQANVDKNGDENAHILQFHMEPADFEPWLMRAGAMPLPPYIATRRAPDAKDAQDYQTLFAQKDGAVAAPTAALHFTPALIEALKEKGVHVEKVTLHVGAGTFLPIKTEDIAAHTMHAEWGEISPEIAARLNARRTAGGRLIAVGTTVLRLLETAADEKGGLRPFSGETDIFITPGYRFKAIDGLMTNFHTPKSTLFMLVAALVGLGHAKAAYAHAIAAGYRFYSYGDSCLIFLR